MSDLKARIKTEMTEAMKSKNAEKLQTIRLIWNAVRKKEIDDRKDLVDSDVEKLLFTMLKQNQESLDQAVKADRSDLAGEIEFEIKIVKTFLPEQLTEADVVAKVTAIAEKLRAEGALPEGPKGMGAMMKVAMDELGSSAEGKVVQGAVRKVLNL